MSLSNLDLANIEWLKDQIIAQADGNRTVNDIIAIVSAECGVPASRVSFVMERATGNRIRVQDDIVTVI